MIAYKLFRLRKNGTIGPLFINRRQIIPIGVWVEAEFHPRKSFAPRKGWHCTLKPVAPHLSLKGRCWYEVSVKNIQRYKRPESQGGTWVLAQRMKIIRRLDEDKA